MKVTNTNSQRVGRDGVYLAANSVTELPDDEAQKVLGIEGVEEGEGDAGTAPGGRDGAFRDPHTYGGGFASMTVGVSDPVGTIIAEAQTAVAAAIAGSFQRVIGDDEAPYGPPTGVVTTKHDAAAASEDARKAFAVNETRLDVDYDPLTAPQAYVQNEAQKAAQVSAAAQVEALANDTEGSPTGDATPTVEVTEDGKGTRKAKARARKPASQQSGGTDDEGNAAEANGGGDSSGDE